MRTIIIIAITAVLALPAVAQDTQTQTQTQTVEISHELITTEDGTRPAHKIEARNGLLDGSIRTDIVGSFLWVQIGDSQTVSVDVSDTSISGAVVSLDGTVSLIHTSTQTAPSYTKTETETETIDLTVKYPTFQPE